MKKQVIVFIGVTLLVVSLLPVSAFAKIEYKGGVYERARYEYWGNVFDMDKALKDSRGFFRFKTSVWGQMDLCKDISFYGKLTNENKAYTYFYQSTSGKKGFHYDINEVVFDNLYVDLKDFLKMPVDLRLGRQDFLGTYGEGFLIMDGTPQDGSRTFYFNAVKASWKANAKNTVDFLYIKDNKTDDNLPIINRLDGEQVLNYTDEWAYALYHKSDSVKNLHWENYYIYKFEEGDQQRKMTQRTTKLNTVGSFARYALAPGWTTRAQLAGQFGKYGSDDRQGLGGYAYLDRDFKDAKYSPSASIGFLYLSGDDPNTDKNEAWDPLFSRYPWISELYVLSWNSDTEMGYWSNLSAWRLQFVVKPTAKTKLSLWYNYLRANTKPTATSLISGSGKTRGHLPQVRFDYAVNKNIKTYVLAEYLFPGNFYTDKEDGAMFFRYELELKF